MEERELESRRFPIGRQPKVERFDPGEVADGIAALAEFPVRLRERTVRLPVADLGRTYRPGGWTVRQLVHHVADSHVNSYTRFRLALTEDRPTIKPYREEHWAELPDAREGEIGVSLALVDAVHARLVALLRTLDEAAWRRVFFHPESGREIPLFENVAIYAWHGRHHLAHIDLALNA